MNPLALLESTPIGRRALLRGSAGFAGALASLSALGTLVTEAQAVSAPVPPAARNVEAALAGFVLKWQAAGPPILLTRFGRFLSNRIFNCHVAGTPRAYHLVLGAAGATLVPGSNPMAHATLVLDEGDWNGMLYGDFTGLAPLLAGRAFPSRDEANRAVLLGIVMYVFAHIPASADNDPAFMLDTMNALIEHRGVVGCAGEPALVEALDDLEADPVTGVSDLVLGVNEAPDVTRELAQWVHDLRYDDIPVEEIAEAKQQLKSILGVAYAGSTMAPGVKFAKAVRLFGDKKEATVLGADGFRTSARNAAMVNSFYAQILEWEDWTFLTHSGAAIVPVVLAAGELAGSSGKDVLTAIVAGNEILARVGEF